MTDAFFPSDLLRTFVEVIDAGSMLQASERVRVTPSAVSLQIKRLEEIGGSPLFFRDRRKLTLTPSGEILEGYARQILALSREAKDMLAGDRASGVVRIGMVEDFARTLLVGTLSRYAELNPDAQVNLRVCGSSELRELVGAGRLDLALMMSLPGDPQVLTTRSTHWFGAERLAERRPVPLALLEEPCLFRSQALAALKLAGIPFEISIETASVSALQAAVQAGLGVTPRTASFMHKLPGVATLSTLPPLPRMGYCVVEAAKPLRRTDVLRRLLSTALEEL